MNATPTSNSRYMIILIAVLIVVLLVLAVNVVLWIWLLGGGMMGGMTLAPGASAGVNGGMMSMMGMNGQTMNDMMSACTEMMRNFQSP